jgi:integrase
MRAKRAVRKKQLTELTVRKAPPERAPYLIWDRQQHGLALRVHPSGNRAWMTIYSRHGRPRWLRLGDANAIGLADARILAAEAMLAVARGGDPAAEKQAERGAGTFAELAGKYVEQHAKKHNKSWRQAETLVRRHALPRWGKLQATTLTRGDVKELMRKIEAPVVANQTLAAVSAIFTWAVREEILPANPCKLVARNPTRDRERVLGDSELPQFWAAFNAADPVVGAALKVILLTGQRPGEVAHMRREHIKDGWWEMPGEVIETLGWPGTKNGQSHRVWLPGAVQKLIASDATTGFVFAGPRGSAVRKLDLVMKTISSKLWVEPVRPHDLRRGHGSTITALGFGRDAMNRIQNHREGGIADVYDRHRYEEENRRIMEATAARIMTLPKDAAATTSSCHSRVKSPCQPSRLRIIKFVTTLLPQVLASAREKPPSR